MLRQWTVDAFASEPFKGNPACVVEPFDPGEGRGWPSDAWMQALANENNQAETAYLLKTDDPARFGLRWFTPQMEVPLCGHATLASAHVLATELGVSASPLRFDTVRSGTLSVTPATVGYAMDFPADPPHRIDIPKGLAEALGAEPLEVWSAAYLIAILADEATVRGLTPDIAALKPISMGAGGGRGDVIVAAEAEAGGGLDVVDRFFAPGAGVPEDPATGSAHCILAPLYAGKLGRPHLRFHQAYPGRGGDIACEVRGDRVILTGAAVTVMETRLRTPRP